MKMEAYARHKRMQDALETQMRAQGQGAGLRMMRQTMARLMRGELGMRVEMWRTWMRDEKHAAFTTRATDELAATLRLQMATRLQSSAIKVLRMAFMRRMRGIIGTTLMQMRSNQATGIMRQQRSAMLKTMRSHHRTHLHSTGAQQLLAAFARWCKGIVAELVAMWFLNQRCAKFVDSEEQVASARGEVERRIAEDSLAHKRISSRIQCSAARQLARAWRTRGTIEKIACLNSWRLQCMGNKHLRTQRATLYDEMRLTGLKELQCIGNELKVEMNQREQAQVLGTWRHTFLSDKETTRQAQKIKEVALKKLSHIVWRMEQDGAQNHLRQWQINALSGVLGERFAQQLRNSHRMDLEHQRSLTQVVAAKEVLRVIWRQATNTVQSRLSEWRIKSASWHAQNGTQMKHQRSLHLVATQEMRHTATRLSNHHLSTLLAVWRKEQYDAVTALSKKHSRKIYAGMRDDMMRMTAVKEVLFVLKQANNLAQFRSVSNWRLAFYAFQGEADKVTSARLTAQTRSLKAVRGILWKFHSDNQGNCLHEWRANYRSAFVVSRREANTLLLTRQLKESHELIAKVITDGEAEKKEALEQYAKHLMNKLTAMMEEAQTADEKDITYMIIEKKQVEDLQGRIRNKISAGGEGNPFL